MNQGGAAHRPPLESRRLLGEGIGAAMIRTDGEIDWWCPNRFEAVPAFWSLLDPKGGSSRWIDAAPATWNPCPAGPTSRSTVRLPGGRVDLWDGLVAVPGGSMLVRLVRSAASELPLVNCLRAGGFDGPAAPWRLTADGATNGQLHVVAERVAIDGSGDLTIEVTGSPEQWTGFAVCAVAGASPAAADAGVHEGALRDAEEQDRRAMSRLRLPRRHPSRATDALRVLRALTHRETGAPVAAPTTSLPEAPGGQRQFDYRYSWLRDSGLAVATAAALGHLTAASRYLAFVGGLMDDDDVLRPVSTSEGKQVPSEREVPGVTGWAASQPIRVGNAAREQRQLDAVASIIEAARVYAASGGAVDRATWHIVDRMAARLADAPFEPTSGVWELRTPRRLVSEEIARWHGLDRALRLRRWHRPWLRRPAWRAARDEARRRVEAAIDPVTGRLPQSFDSDSDSEDDADTPDAAVLLAVTTGLLPRRDRRAARLVAATIEALEEGAFLRRYPPRDDGFKGVEAAFVPSSWWAVTALACIGDVDAARARADELCLKLPPLQPEEWDVERDAARGNTPLLWSHMEAARALYVLQREELRQRVGTIGVGLWGAARYVRLRLGRGDL